MQVDFLEIMESLFHIHNIEMTLIRLEDLPAETSDFTDILQKLTLDFKSRQISEAILKALKPNCISILHTETMLNYVLFTATPDMQQEYQFDFISIGPYLTAPLTHEELLTLIQILHLPMTVTMPCRVSFLPSPFFLEKMISIH